MRVEFYGLTLDSPGVTVYLRSPWRCSLLEHKLFDALRTVPGITVEQQSHEWRAHIQEQRTWRQVLHVIARVLKGWQEEAADATREERRRWRWMLEADVDAAGYDMHGMRACFWAYIRLTIDYSGPGDYTKDSEDVDLLGFEVCIWGHDD
ncbi:MAG: hypothetical protein NZ703_02390 [Gemmataceae bacterium]|nr:hypothetical protein [Gemmataceae bacterium]MCS7269909.1 hypothetical protein [Gemmataceae bacterium]MDW8244102.1 hypothetical protein [Thermogemmata sp.]